MLHVTWVTAVLSLPVPASVSGVVFVANVVAVVGLVMATVGGVVSGAGGPPTGVFMSDWISVRLSARL